MKLGILQFELLIHDCHSLKEKRRVVRSVKDRLIRHHKVSVGEVGLKDTWGASRLGLAFVSDDVAHISRELDLVMDRLRSLTDAELGEVRREIVDADAMSDPFVDGDGVPLWTPSERRDAECPPAEASA